MGSKSSYGREVSPKYTTNLTTQNKDANLLARVCSVTCVIQRDDPKMNTT